MGCAPAAPLAGTRRVCFSALVHSSGAAPVWSPPVVAEGGMCGVYVARAYRGTVVIGITIFRCPGEPELGPTVGRLAVVCLSVGRSVCVVVVVGRRVVAVVACGAEVEREGGECKLDTATQRKAEFAHYWVGRSVNGPAAVQLMTPGDVPIPSLARARDCTIPAKGSEGPRGDRKGEMASGAFEGERAGAWPARRGAAQRCTYCLHILQACCSAQSAEGRTPPARRAADLRARPAPGGNLGQSRDEGGEADET